MTLSHKIGLLILIILAYLFAYWVLAYDPFAYRPVRAEYNRDHDPHYHGADALTIGWKGEIIAYKWENGKYRAMWTRRAK